RGRLATGSNATPWRHAARCNRRDQPRRNKPRPGSEHDQSQTDRRASDHPRRRTPSPTEFPARCDAAGSDCINPDRTCDVLELLLARISPVKDDLALDLTISAVRKANPPGIGERLQPRGNVDPIAVDALTVPYDVAHIDADAKLHPPLRLDRGIAGCHV